MAQSVHENVKSVLFYLDTRVRTGGTIGSPTFTFPNNLIDIRPQKGEQVRLTMQEASIEYTFYQTELFNNKFLVREQTSDTGGEYVNRIVELDIGNYNLNTLIVELTNKLNIAASLYVYLISYIPKTNRLRFIATPKVGTSVSVIFDFNVESVQTIIGVFLGESANEILGFAIGATIVLTDTNFSGNLICESQIPITMSPGVQNLFITIANSCSNYGNANTANSFTASNILAKIPVSNPPFSVLYFYDLNSNFNTIILNKYLDNLNLTLFNERFTRIEPRKNWTLTIKIEIIRNSTSAEVLKTLKKSLELDKLKMVRKDNNGKKSKSKVSNPQTEAYRQQAGFQEPPEQTDQNKTTT